MDFRTNVSTTSEQAVETTNQIEPVELSLAQLALIGGGVGEVIFG